jgi:hypothetical protein
MEAAKRITNDNFSRGFCTSKNFEPTTGNKFFALFSFSLTTIFLSTFDKTIPAMVVIGSGLCIAYEILLGKSVKDVSENTNNIPKITNPFGMEEDIWEKFFISKSLKEPEILGCRELGILSCVSKQCNIYFAQDKLWEIYLITIRGGCSKPSEADKGKYKSLVVKSIEMDLSCLRFGGKLAASAHLLLSEINMSTISQSLKVAEKLDKDIDTKGYYKSLISAFINKGQFDEIDYYLEKENIHLGQFYDKIIENDIKNNELDKAISHAKRIFLNDQSQAKLSWEFINANKIEHLFTLFACRSSNYHYGFFSTCITESHDLLVKKGLFDDAAKLKKLYPKSFIENEAKSGENKLKETINFYFYCQQYELAEKKAGFSQAHNKPPKHTSDIYQLFTLGYRELKKFEDALRIDSYARTHYYVLDSGIVFETSVENDES